ncbi:MAG: ABC transporter substrate-binding protein [Deltaproteobacteria bacterium]|nr:ABC transporter substrate-binding protein [Deltaproteobacteria bacterium]MBW1924017.1 ABC transporter substrate-binding protein [Deltaproteobacteria bacterium]MBW1950612.1 ABC transporter substrate-binding protein [Deltaproteobacteria bacterium]MBW2008869.1 ABC transporter substrate-binding protein [Deltaproteobacteria bacterium]MBW2348360.1 ABC transporter substrate-binding protein [Deltaproteobacteria bacterium]
MKKGYLGFFVSLFLLAGTAWGDAIKIPVASPFTGQLASFGEGVKNGALLKGSEINASGGIRGRKVKIVLEDELCDPKEAATVATKLANDPAVSIVVGHLCSSATLAALPIYRAAKLPAISPASTNVSIGKMSPFYFRNVYKDDFQGLFLAKYAHFVKGYKKVAIFYEVNDYSMGLMLAFMKEAKKLGIKILGTEAYTADTTDFKPQLTKFKMMKPDAIFIPGYAPQGTLIVSQAVSLGIRNAGFFGADGLDDDLMLKNPDAEGLFVTTPFLPDKAGPRAAGFIRAYRKAYGKDPNWFAANSYDAVGLAAAAITAVGQDRVKIRDYLASINTREKAYEGVAGKTYFDKNGDCLKDAFVKEIRGGKWVSAQKQLRQ